MWAEKAELAKAVADELMKRLHPPERSTYVASEPPPFRPEKPKKNETYIEMLQRRTRDDIRAGRAVSANMMRPKPRPPRAPDQQQLRSNGFWSWWS